MEKEKPGSGKASRRAKPEERAETGKPEAAEPSPASKSTLPAEPASKKPAFKETTQNPDLLVVDAELGELPPGYDEDRAVLLVRDPYWVYTYWDLSQATLAAAETRGDFRQILRIQELGGFGETRPSYFYDVPVPGTVRSWYLRLPGDGRRYQVEVALQHRDGTYTPVARTNAVEAPKSEPSELVADRFVTLPEGEPQLPDRPQTLLPPVAQWEAVVAPLAPEGPPAPDPSFAETGPDASFPTAPLGVAEPNYRPFATGPWSGEMPAALRPEAQGPAGPLPSSLGSQSVGSWSVGASESRYGGPRPKNFWLVADAELIVYGATEPDAKVTLRGERVDLQPDGTFSFRFYLPDGLHPIPIRAINADGDDERQITITVSRSTAGDGKTNLRKLAAEPHIP